MEDQIKEAVNAEKKAERSADEVRAFFAKDRFATNNGAVIEEFADGYARCNIELNENHLNAVGGVQGGVHYMLSDFAFAVATNHKVSRTVSLNCNIAYLGTVKGKKMIAEAHRVKDGRSTCYYRVDVKDDLGNLVAVTNITGFHK
jgi:acyl-CoA thioesterase